MKPSSSSPPLKMKSSPAAMSKMEQLPEGIVVGILSRLTARTLFCNCRLVCKSWLRLISEPSFAGLQASASPAGFLVARDDLGFSFQQFEACAAAGNKEFPRFEVQSLDFTYLYKSMGGDWELCNSCNGLLCFSSQVENEPLYVCNPILGELITIQPLTSDVAGGYPCLDALGFCVAKNEYKVLRRGHFYMVGSGLGATTAAVYTLGSRVWRSIASAPRCVLLGDDSSVYLNGVCHWTCVETSQFIQTFDYEKEEFGLLPMPRCDRRDSQVIRHFGLQVLRGCLLLSVEEFLSDSHSHVMWLMKDYGVQESWVKFVVTENTSDCLRPIMCWSDEEILTVRDSRAVVCYNQKTRRFRKIYTSADSLYATDYSPTLISLYDVAPGELVKRVLAGESFASDGSENFEAVEEVTALLVEP